MHQQPEQHNGHGSDKREAIRAEVAETCAHLAGKLETLQTMVLKPVEGAHEVLQTTVSAAQTAVGATNEAYSCVRRQVEERPWTAAGAGLAAGAFAGYLLSAKPPLNPPSPAVALQSNPTVAGQAAKSVASVALGVGVAMLRDWLTDRFPTFKDPIHKALEDVTAQAGLVRFENRFLPPQESSEVPDPLHHRRFGVRN